MRSHASHGCSAPPARVRLRMPRVGLPVPGVLSGQLLAPNDEEVLGIVVLGPLREIEGPRDDHRTIRFRSTEIRPEFQPDGSLTIHLGDGDLFYT